MNSLNIPVHDCQNCGECCGLIPTTRDNFEEIRNYMKKHNIEALDNEDETCPFRDKNNRRCLVYPVRPIVCRLMGVTQGMHCKYGNSQEIDGWKFVQRSDDMVILNFVKWV